MKVMSILPISPVPSVSKTRNSWPTSVSWSVSWTWWYSIIAALSTNQDAFSSEQLYSGTGIADISYCCQYQRQRTFQQRKRILGPFGLFCRYFTHLLRTFTDLDNAVLYLEWQLSVKGRDTFLYMRTQNSSHSTKPLPSTSTFSIINHHQFETDYTKRK